LPPIFQPEAIADVVCRAARNPPRELWLGFSALKAIAGGMAAAGLLDRYLAKKGMKANSRASLNHSSRLTISSRQRASNMLFTAASAAGRAPRLALFDLPYFGWHSR
jgi:hypothetical protein